MKRLDPTAPGLDPEVWSTPEKRRRTRKGYGPHPKPNVCPVPHRLRELPLERFGYPVPWVSDWTATSVPGRKTDYQPVPTRPEWGHYNASEEGIGEGHALAGLLHPGRQMRAMLLRLCGVCGKHIKGRAILIGGPGLLASGFHEPPVHRDCARYALQACPGINGGRVIVVEAKTYECMPVWGDAGGRVYRLEDLGGVAPAGIMPLVAVYALAAPDSVVYTTASWARHTKTPPHPGLEDGFPEWSLSDLRTHPDADGPG